MFKKKYEELRERISNVDKTRVDDKQEACRRENRLFSKLEGRIHHLENKVEEIKDNSNQITDLKADVHELRFPMGEIDKWGQEDKCFGMSRMAMYIYANKKYSVHDISCFSITGYRKQGDYIQIRWEEEHRVTSYKEEIPTIVEHTKTYLLKDELIPLEDCEVKFDCEFVEVE